MRSSIAWCASAALAGAVACAAPLGWLARPRLPDCPGPLVASDTIPGDFLWRERVRYRGARVETSLELAVEKRGDRLVVVGFNELGAKAFEVVQEGLDVHARSHLGPGAAVRPRTVLRDLHRARLAGGAAPLAPAPDVSLRPPGCDYEVSFARLSAQPL